MSRTARLRRPLRSKVQNECVIGPTSPPAVLQEHVLADPGREPDEIVRYVEWQAHEGNSGGPIAGPRLTAVWRRVAQAREALDRAENGQAIGNRCRECLLDLTRIVSTADMVPCGGAAGLCDNWGMRIGNALSGLLG